MVDLITGKAGKPHIDGNSLGVLNAGIIGPDDYALDYGDKFAITLDDSNHATIATGCAMLNGRQALISTPEQVTITSGSQGMKRNDLICLRYQRVVSTGIESCTLVVVRGTATTGTPADPTVNTGSILNLVTVHDMPLYRIPLDGITVGTPVPLFNILKPMKDVWDSLTHASQWWAAEYKMQNSGSFVPFNYGGANRLLYNPGLRLIRVDLTPFRSAVKVGRYQCYLASSGALRPSKAMSIGQAILDNGQIGRELTLNADGTISVGPEINNGDLIKPLPNLVPIPSDVAITMNGLSEV